MQKLRDPMDDGLASGKPFANRGSGLARVCRLRPHTRDSDILLALSCAYYALADA